MKYKVVYFYNKGEWVYGYADSIGEAIELYNQCGEDGWNNRRIRAWDEVSGRWVMIN